MNSCFFFTLILLGLQTNVTMVSIIPSYLHILHNSKAAHRDGVDAQYIQYFGSYVHLFAS